MVRFPEKGSPFSFPLIFFRDKYAIDVFMTSFVLNKPSNRAFSIRDLYVGWYKVAFVHPNSMFSEGFAPLPMTPLTLPLKYTSPSLRYWARLPAADSGRNDTSV